MDKKLTEEVVLKVSSPPMSKANGLTSALNDLGKIRAVLGQIQANITGLAVNPVSVRSVQQLATEFKSIQNALATKGGLTLGNLSQHLGEDVKTVRAHLASLKGEQAAVLKEFKKSDESFRSGPAAARFFQTYLARRQGVQAAAAQGVAGLFSGAGVGGIQAKLGGPITLEIPGSMVHAVLTGPISAAAPAGMATAAGVAVPAVAAHGPATAKIGASLPPSPAVGANVIKQRITNIAAKNKWINEVTESVGQYETLLSQYVDDAATPKKTVRTITPRALGEIKTETARIKKMLRADKGLHRGMDESALATLADLESRAEIQLAAVAQKAEGLGQTGMSQSLKEDADILKRQSAAHRAAAVRAAASARAKQESDEAKERAKQSEEAKRIEGRSMPGATAAAKAQEQSRSEYQALWQRLLAVRQAEEHIAGLEAKGWSKRPATSAWETGPQGMRRSQQTVLEREAGGFKETITATAQLSKAGEVLGYSFNRTSLALAATGSTARAAGRDFLSNTAHVTTWAASVGLLYGTIGLMRTSLQSLMDTGLQTARLQQVFSGIGGSAQDLRNDVQALASMQGRSSQEAMDAAVRWSRLGLSRAQVNEAVRVSLIAANVAELDAATATEKLMGIMAAYQLRVTNMASVLGMLNQVSNTWNVTNKDMLEGLSRTASIAKQAGLPLAELIGIIGATVGTTGQTGANIGNAIKSLIVGLGNPVIQQFLRHEFRIEVTAGGTGELKDMSDILADIWGAYQGLDKLEAGVMMSKMAGKTQTSRVTAMLDSYVKGQVLAIDAQRNLNSAETENVLIKAALASQMRAIATEWDRLVANMGRSGAGQSLGFVAESFKNLLRVMASPVGAGALTVLMGLMTALAAKSLLVGMSLKSLAGGTGIVANTMRQFHGVMGSVNTVFGRVNAMAFSTLRAYGPIVPMLRSIMVHCGLLGRVLVTAFSSLYLMAPELAILFVGFWAFNRAMEWLGKSSETAERKLAGFTNEAERAANAARAAAQAGQLLSTIQRNLPNLKDRAGTMKLLADAKLITPDEATRILGDKSKDSGLGKKILGDKATQQFRKASYERALEVSNEAAKLKRLQEEITRLEGSWLGKSDLAEKRKQLADAEGKYLKMLQEEEEGSADAYTQATERGTKHLSNLEREKALAESIAEIYRELPAFGPVERATAEVAALEAKLRVLRSQSATQTAALDAATRNSLLGREDIAAQEQIIKAKQLAFVGSGARPLDVLAGTPLQKERLDELRREEEKLANLRKLKSPEEIQLRSRRAATEKSIQDTEIALADKRARAQTEAMERARIQMGTEMAKAQGEAGAIGINETDRLLNKEANLRTLIAQKQAVINNAAASGLEKQNALVASLEHHKDLIETINQKNIKGYDVARQQQQLEIDRRREFQKSLITAGPADLLRKLAAATLGPHLSMGQFFSLSPQMREDVGNVNARWSPEWRDLQSQRNQLGQPPSTEAGFREMMGLAAEVSKLQSMIKFPEQNATILNNQAVASALATAEVGRLAGAAQLASKALETLQQVPDFIAQIGTAIASLSQPSQTAGQAPYLQAAEGVLG